MELEAKLEELSLEMGTDLFGIADLTPARKAIENLY